MLDSIKLLNSLALAQEVSPKALKPQNLLSELIELSPAGFV